MISWRVRLVDIQAKPEKPLDRKISPWDSDCGRGMVRRADRYLAQRFQRGQAREGKRVPAWHDSDGTSGPAAWGFHHVQEPETTTGLGSG